MNEDKIKINLIIKESKQEIKILNKKFKRYYSKYNPGFMAVAERDNRVKKYKQAIGNTKSIKKMVKDNQLYCNHCGSMKFSDKQQLILCDGCSHAESKQKLIENKFSTKNVSIRSKEFYYAKRASFIFEKLSELLSEKEIRKLLRKFLLSKEERTFSFLMEKEYNSRVDYLGRTGFMMPTSEWYEYRFFEDENKSLAL